MRILEATVAVMIVAGVMLTTYTGSETRTISVEDYADTVQTEILADLVLRSDLRLAILNTDRDLVSDANYVVVNDYVASQVPDGYGYLLRICELDSSSDYCKMSGGYYVATLDKDVYVEETVVAAEVGEGDDAVYDPKKVKIYLWEGEIDPNTCVDECDRETWDYVCQESLRGYVTMSCHMTESGCLVWAMEHDSEVACGDSEVCSGGVCVATGSGDEEVLTCGKDSSYDLGCVDDGDQGVVWAGYDSCIETGGCDCIPIIGCEGDYTTCYRTDSWVSGCEVDPVCPSGYDEVSREACSTCSDECSTDSYYCLGDDVMKQVCSDSDSDGCLELGAGVVEQSCSGGTSCVDASCVGDDMASVELTFSDVNAVFNSGYWYYYHTRTFSETNGVGVTFTSGQACYSFRNDCDSASVNYRVEANGQYSWSSYFYSSYVPSTFTMTYYGTDDNGNSVTVSNSFTASGSSY